MNGAQSCRGRWPYSVLVFGPLLVGLISPSARADIDDEINKAAKQLELLEGKAGLIQHEYLQFEDKAHGSMRFESRLNDGQAMMLLKDYVGAAIVFYDLVQNKKNIDYLFVPRKIQGVAPVGSHAIDQITAADGVSLRLAVPNKVDVGHQQMIGLPEAPGEIT